MFANAAHYPSVYQLVRVKLRFGVVSVSFCCFLAGSGP